MKIIIPVAVLLSMALLSGCATGRAYGPESPYYEYPEGTRLTLDRPVEIPAGTARVGIQHGQAVPLTMVDEFEPHCVLLGRTVSDAPRRLQPGCFEVVGVMRSISIIAEADVPPPSVSLFQFAHGDTPSHVYYKTHFHLRSAAQPRMCSLICMVNRPDMASPDARHLTLPEIRRTLGEVVTVDIQESR